MNKTREAVVNTQQKRHYTTVGKVLETNEKQNFCVVEVNDSTGKQITTNAFLKISQPGFMSYFPSTCDLVYIDCYQNTYSIVGPYYNEHHYFESIYKIEKNNLHTIGFDLSEGNII